MCPFVYPLLHAYSIHAHPHTSSSSIVSVSGRSKAAKKLKKLSLGTTLTTIPPRFRPFGFIFFSCTHKFFPGSQLMSVLVVVVNVKKKKDRQPGKSSMSSQKPPSAYIIKSYSRVVGLQFHGSHNVTSCLSQGMASISYLPSSCLQYILVCVQKVGNVV